MQQLEHYILERPLVKEVRNSTSWHPHPSTKKLLGIILLTQPTKQTFLVRGGYYCWSILVSWQDVLRWWECEVWKVKPFLTFYDLCITSRHWQAFYQDQWFSILQKQDQMYVLQNLLKIGQTFNDLWKRKAEKILVAWKIIERLLFWRWKASF